MLQIFSPLSHETSGSDILKYQRTPFQILEFFQFDFKATNVGKIQTRQWINGFTINNFSKGDFTNIPPALPTEKK